MKNFKILEEVNTILKDGSLDFVKQLHMICDFLHSKKSNYDWVGYYFADVSQQTLHLGPFAGEPTEHKIIPFGKGICGQVAERHETFLVKDVNAQDNYIACSINVKSEIVVPLFVNVNNVGQIDIDSHTRNAFEAEDEKLLNQINRLVADKILTDKVDLKTLRV